MSNLIDIDQIYCKGCKLCIAVCPKEVYELSETRNAKGYLVPAATGVENCIGCQKCEMTCPDQSITVTVVDKGAKKNAA